MLWNNLEPEDFLHLVTSPPEIYLGEGGMTQLIQDTDVYHTQDVKLDLINNVINRIVVAESNHFTYQDQVFITSVLRKLGIYKTEDFMQQVNLLKAETRSTEELIQLYWDHVLEIQNMTMQYRQERMQSNGTGDGTEPEAKEASLYLHQSIMNRLQTGAIYQEIQNFNVNYQSSDSYIHQEEMQVSEQSVTARNILLNRLQNITYMEEEPFVYQHINTYEYASGEEEVLSQKTVTSQLIQAVLLNVIDRVYSMRLTQIMNNKDNWYWMNDILYRSAENTLERF
jgi:hypothetical protein